MVIKGFKKYGISLAIDNSEDDEINVKCLEGYQIESDDDDPFATSEDCSDSDSSSENDDLDSGDEDCVDKDCDVPFTMPFNLITNEECLLPSDSAFNYSVEFQEVTEDYFTLQSPACVY